MKFIRFLKYPKKWRFPHLRHFVESPCIHVHLIALDPLENSLGMKLEAARLSPQPRKTWAECYTGKCNLYLQRNKPDFLPNAFQIQSHAFQNHFFIKTTKLKPIGYR